MMCPSSSVHPDVVKISSEPRELHSRLLVTPKVTVRCEAVGRGFICGRTRTELGGVLFTLSSCLRLQAEGRGMGLWGLNNAGKNVFLKLSLQMLEIQIHLNFCLGTIIARNINTVVFSQIPAVVTLGGFVKQTRRLLRFAARFAYKLHGSDLGQGA